MNKWALVYKSAINPDGSVLFPEKLSADFLETQKQKLGSYSFANQYLGVIVPEELQCFRKEWFVYHNEIPKRVYNYAMIDPAIGQKKSSDYTGIVIVSADTQGNWYIQVANRERLTPSQIVNKCFEIQKEFSCMAIGIESVGYQQALLYMLAEEMRRRKIIIPIKECKPPTDRTKEARIRGLIPRFEWRRVSMKRGLYDLESEMLTFPRAAHDDIVDALAYMDEFIIYPEETKEDDSIPPHPNDPKYEQYYIRQRYKAANQT